MLEKGFLEKGFNTGRVYWKKGFLEEGKSLLEEGFTRGEICQREGLVEEGIPR